MNHMYRVAMESWRDNLDFVWIHYSGHGSYMRDTSGDEKDGRDECLIPSDYETAGVIPDDYINQLFSYFNPATRVICVFDCCHSGTIGDVKYGWESPTRVIVENILCSVKARIITFSGCMDTQTSADAFNTLGDNMYGGALTGCLLMALREGGTRYKGDVFGLLQDVRNKLRARGFAQVPKLCSTYNLAKDRLFIPSV